MSKIWRDAYEALSPDEQRALASEPDADDFAHAAEVAELRGLGLPVPGGTAPVIAQDRLDVAALWRSLPEADRDRIGELALGIMVGGTIAAMAERTAPAASRAGGTHYDLCLEELCNGGNPDAVTEALQGPSWRLPETLGPVCLECGCTSCDACDEGCGWANAEQTLCTACAKPRAYTEADIPF